MPDAKRPKDHEPKQVKPVDEVKTVTLDGHKYRIDPAVFDDLRFMELYEDEKWIGLLRHVLGPEQWQAFYRNHADDKGRVTSARFEQIMNDFQGAFSEELGNSSASTA